MVKSRRMIERRLLLSEISSRGVIDRFRDSSDVVRLSAVVAISPVSLQTSQQAASRLPHMMFIYLSQ